jgi:hypothetical protein
MTLNLDAALCSELKSLIGKITNAATDYKYLDAKILYNRLISKLNWTSELEEGQAATGKGPSTEQLALSKSVTDLLAQHKDTFEMVLCRVDEVEYALSNMSLDQSLAAAKSDASASAGGSGDQVKWQFGSSYLGVTTHYVQRPDGLLTLHVEGIVDNLPFFEQLAVINEIDLFKEWVRIIVLLFSACILVSRCFQCF